MTAAAASKVTADFDISACSCNLEPELNLLQTDEQELKKELTRDGQAFFDREEDGAEAQVEAVALIKNKTSHLQSNKVESKFNLLGCCCCGPYSWKQIKWSNVLWLITLHIFFFFAFAHCLTSPVKLQSVFWTVFTSIFSGIGMSVGAHRMWAHRTFKAKLPLRFFLLFFQTMTINGSAFSFARDHRNHHKWPATHADPKNPGRGFFFAHIGWWLLKKRPEVAQFGAKVPIDDLLEDRLLMFQHRFYVPLVILISILLPIAVPYLLWNENLLTSASLTVIRLVVVLHHLFTVNSVAHFWGHRPYNRWQKPTENVIINWISMGEGQHNFHHTFPFDYRNSEYRWWEVFNPASLFIEVTILLFLASQPKKPTPSLIQKVIETKGRPEYFEASRQWSLCQKVAFGVVDWCLGAALAQWPMWIVVIYKAAAGRTLIVL